jgi:hypothetical protein
MSYGVMAPCTVEQAPYTILATKTVGPWVDISRWRRGAFRMPVGATTTSFTFNVSNDQDLTGGVAYPLRDAAGAALAQTVVANKWFPLLPSLFSYRFVQFVPNAAPAGNVAMILSGVDGPVSWRRISAPFGAGGTVSPNLDLGGASAGSFVTPAGFQGATVTFLIGGGGSDLQAAVDAANVAIAQTTAASQLLTLPREAFGTSFLAILAATAQGAARVVDVWLKQEG